MIEEIKKIKSTKKDFKHFGLTIGLILFLIGVFLYYKEIESSLYIFTIGTIFIFLALIAPSILKPIYKIWMVFAVVIGWIMTRLILSILFYTIITGIGILTRLIGKDFLNLKLKDQESYWNIRDNEHELNQDYEKQF
tara:strand:- start:870 stop:1280 length:411 start_codon:yes stop_codon:yes gene_type:complete